jgi:hypothetical protein
MAIREDLVASAAKCKFLALGLAVVAMWLTVLVQSY